MRSACLGCRLSGPPASVAQTGQTLAFTCSNSRDSSSVFMVVLGVHTCVVCAQRPIYFRVNTERGSTNWLLRSLRLIRLVLPIVLNGCPVNHVQGVRLNTLHLSPSTTSSMHIPLSSHPDSSASRGTSSQVMPSQVRYSPLAVISMSGNRSDGLSYSLTMSCTMTCRYCSQCSACSQFER